MTGPHELSVLTPSYNYARYLPSCLRSVRRHSGTIPVQHVVVDDGSTDSSWSVIQREHAEPARDCLRHDNTGLAATLNDAMALARGDWLSWLNSDDYHLPWTVALLEQTLRRVPDADLVVGDTVFVDDESRFLRLVSRPRFDPRIMRGGYNPFLVPSVFWRRSLRPEWRFDESMQLFMDLDLWFALTSGPCTVVKVDAPLSAFRRHDTQVSASSRTTDVDELRLLGRRYGVPRLVSAASDAATRRSRLRHATYRLLGGSAVRELRARRLRGSPMDWTVDDTLAERLLSGPTPPALHVTRVG